MRYGIAFVLLVMLAACTAKKNPVQPAVAAPVTDVVEAPVTDTLLYYSRGACFGMCPIFEFTLMKDGRALYLGKNHVDRIGRYQTMVSYTDAQHVLKKAKEIGYFELKAEYDNENVHDLPDIITAIADNGNLHRVRNRYKGPAALRNLYSEIDSLIERQAWKPVGIPSQE